MGPRTPTAADRRSLALLDKIRRPSGFGSRAPHIAGTIVGVLAAIALLSSLFPAIRHLIHDPRRYVDDYLITLPDTSFAWAFVLALIAVALSARKRIAWWISVIYLILFMATNAFYLVPSLADDLGVTRWDRTNIYLGLFIDALALMFLLSTYRQFYTRVRKGAVLAAFGTLIAGLAIATLLGWALVWAFPHTLTRGDRLPYAFNRVVTFGSIDSRTFDGHHTHIVIDSALGLLGALALMLVIEGLLPFISPARWRSVFEQALKLMRDGE